MILMNGQKLDRISLGDNSIRAVYIGDTERWSAAIPIIERSVGDVLRYGNNTYVILDFNHKHYPQNTVQILTLQGINIDYQAGREIRTENQDQLLSLFPDDLQGALVQNSFRTGMESEDFYAGDGTYGGVRVYSHDALVNVPSLYEVGLAYTPEWSGSTIGSGDIDGEAFEFFKDKNNWESSVTYALRSYDYENVIVDRESVVSAKYFYALYAARDSTAVHWYRKMTYKKTYSDSGNKETRTPIRGATARAIASLPITMRVSPKPDENGIYDIFPHWGE